MIVRCCRNEFRESSFHGRSMGRLARSETISEVRVSLALEIVEMFDSEWVLERSIVPGTRRSPGPGPRSFATDDRLESQMPVLAPWCPAAAAPAAPVAHCATRIRCRCGGHRRPSATGRDEETHSDERDL